MRSLSFLMPILTLLAACGPAEVMDPPPSSQPSPQHGAPAPEPSAQPGSVEVEWSFSDGRTCADLDGAISGVRLTIPGQALPNSGNFACSVAGTQGIVLENFAPGDYRAVVEALDASGQVASSGQASFTVDGDVAVTVWLSPWPGQVAQPQPQPQPQPGDATLSWSFADGNTCASLGGAIEGIQVSIPGLSLPNGGYYACSASGFSGVDLVSLAPGAYSVSVQAIGPSSAVSYQGSGSFTVDGNVQANVVLYPVAQPQPQPQPGDATLSWSFADGNTCASLGGTLAGIQVSVPGLSLPNGGFFACESGGFSGVTLGNLAPGSYTFTAQALDPSFAVAYQGSGGFTIDGSVQVGLTLYPLAQPEPQPQPGDVTLTWSFADGNTCSSLSGQVDHMVVSIPGEFLANGGAYACGDWSGQGVTLQSFAPGSYSFTVDAVDASGSALFHAAGSFTVDGSVAVQASLQPLAPLPSPGQIQLRWSFLDASGYAQTCAQAGVDSVQVTLGDYAPQVVPCTANGTDGVDVGPLPPGTYSLDLEGQSGLESPVVTYQVSATVAVDPGQVTLAQVALQPTTGSLELSFDFLGASCTESGVTSLSVSLTDQSGQELSGYAPGATIPCQDGGSVRWERLPPGTLTIRVQGYDAWSNLTWGALSQTTLVAGAENMTTATLDSCGAYDSGC